jgi:hypothetical protein
MGVCCRFAGRFRRSFEAWQKDFHDTRAQGDIERL